MSILYDNVIYAAEGVIDEIDPTRMDQPDVAEEGSIKDIVARLTGWQPRLIARLQAAQRDQPLRFGFQQAFQGSPNLQPCSKTAD